MKKISLGTIALVALIAGPAMAADLARPAPVYKALPPPVPVFSWTGCYIGANVGGAWASQDADTVGPANAPANTNQAPDFVSLKGSSVIGGVHGGCNIQFASVWVAGIEGDWSGTKIDNTQSGPNLFFSGTPAGSGGVSFNRDTKWLASVRGRLGVAVVPNVLLYATGGGAWTRTDYSGLDVFTGGCPNCGATSFSSTKSGWVVGGGGEWAPWSNNWLFRVEYLYYRFKGDSGNAFFQSVPSVLAATFNFHDLSINELRVGLSYKFGGPVVANY
jgi:outer membrane immunogenic protein